MDERAHAPADTALRIAAVEAWPLEVPLAAPVRSPMGEARTAVGLLVAVRDADGTEGWGEVFCNFPRFGLRHRARLVQEVFAPWLVGRPLGSPAEAFAGMTAMSNVLRLQSGETGPVAAAIAGIDIALHDIVAQRAGEPLWRLLGGRDRSVAVYASIGRALDARAAAERCMEHGFRAIKVRSSGAIAQHLALLEPLRELVGPDCALMLDLNSSWEAEAAIATVAELAPIGLAWLEEPIPVDAPTAQWARLARAAPMPLAGGENMVTPAMFDAAFAQRALAVLQPDIAKWGGFSGGVPLARRILAEGFRLCPHFFGGAVGLLASAHLLAAVGGDGMLEYDVGSSALRDDLLELAPRDGRLELPDRPGLGLRPSRAVLERHRVQC